MPSRERTGRRSGSEAGSYLRLIDSCITQLKSQGPSRTCNESKEEDVQGEGGRVEVGEGVVGVGLRRLGVRAHPRRVRGPGVAFRFENNCFTEMCSGSEAGSYSRLIDFVYHSTLGLRVIKKRREDTGSPPPRAWSWCSVYGLGFMV